MTFFPNHAPRSFRALIIFFVMAFSCSSVHSQVREFELTREIFFEDRPTRELVPSHAPRIIESEYTLSNTSDDVTLRRWLFRSTKNPIQLASPNSWETETQTSWRVQGDLFFGSNSVEGYSALRVLGFFIQKLNSSSTFSVSAGPHVVLKKFSTLALEGNVEILLSQNHLAKIIFSDDFAHQDIFSKNEVAALKVNRFVLKSDYFDSNFLEAETSLSYESLSDGNRWGRLKNQTLFYLGSNGTTKIGPALNWYLSDRNSSFENVAYWSPRTFVSSGVNGVFDWKLGENLSFKNSTELHVAWENAKEVFLHTSLNSSLEYGDIQSTLLNVQFGVETSEQNEKSWQKYSILIGVQKLL